MNLKTILATNNNCYKSGKKHTVRGIMVHSTGANNPELRRYVAPDDGTIGKNQYGNDWNRPTPSGREICAHAFIGKLADGSVATVQTLPWDMVGWHSGSGAKGYNANANNNGYIGFEICEDNLTSKEYFEKVYKEAAELCAMLCKQYKLNPTTAIICHSEGHTQGIASNHGDVMHWFPKHGKNMDTFRSDVRKLIRGKTMDQYKVTATIIVTEDKLEGVISDLKARGCSISQEKIPATQKAPAKSDIAKIALEVVQGKWGNNPSRKQKLIAAGHNYEEIQKIVNTLV